MRRLAALGRSGDGAAVQAGLAVALMEVLGVEQVHVLALDGGPSLAYRGPLEPEAYLPTGCEAAAWVAAHGQPVAVDSDRAVAGLGPEMTGHYRMAGALLMPLSVDGVLRAVLAVGGQVPRAWPAADIELACALLDVAGLATARVEEAAAAAVARLGDATGPGGHATPAAIAVSLDDLGALAKQHGATVREAIADHVAELLRGQIAASGQVGRLTDDTFTVLLPDTPPTHADAIGENVLELLRGTLLAFADGEQALRVSIGLAEGHPGEAGEQLLARALAALGLARTAGGDRLVHAT